MRDRMRIVSINVGEVERIGHGAWTLATGICKRPVARAVRIHELGLEGDTIVDERHHGGADQAVYVYSADDYRWWAESEGREFPPGLFGENLTIEGLPSNLYVGDRLLIGDVVLEATSARIPCGTLATRMDDRNFGLTFRNAERPGIYCRVLHAGDLRAGDTVTLVETSEGNVSVLDLFRFAYRKDHNAEQLGAFLEAPIAERVRAQVESKLAAL